MAQTIQGIITNYRIGPRTQKARECIIKFSHVESVSQASRLVGRKIVWKAERKELKIVGKIVALHGKKGLVRARFRKGLPGQALGTTVELVG